MAVQYEYLDHPGPIPFAHRGGASDAPENTLPAFQRAVDLGYRYLETDVQVTSDGVIAAFHDDDLLRTTGRPGRIGDLRWSEVRTALVDGKEPIPALDELLSSFPHCRFNIDCKSDQAVAGLVSVLKRTRSVSRLCIGSFSTTRLARVRRQVGPELCTSLGPAEVAGWQLAARVPGRWPRLRAPCIQVPPAQRGMALVTARSVAAAHAQGGHVHVWTIDDPAEMDRLLDLGVDGLMTDKPAILKAVLERRGQWA